MAIEIKQVSKQFGDTVALDQVNLTFTENHIYGLLGNNGAGKTTLLNLLTNRLYPTAGQVLVDGEPVQDNDRALGKLFLMSESNLFPDEMRVGRALRIAGDFYPKFNLSQAEELAKRFELPLRKKITALSTGYSSIFRLVLALSVNTPYLLLDEPVLGLDAQHRDLFYKLLLQKYSEEPCTIIISTHLIQEVAALIEHTVIISHGRVLQDMPTDALLDTVHQVCGPTGAVDDYLRGRRVLSQNILGGLKTACLAGPAEQVPAGLEVSRVELQDYFIALMDEEDAQ